MTTNRRHASLIAATKSSSANGNDNDNEAAAKAAASERQKQKDQAFAFLFEPAGAKAPSPAYTYPPTEYDNDDTAVSFLEEDEYARTPPIVRPRIPPRAAPPSAVDLKTTRKMSPSIMEVDDSSILPTTNNDTSQLGNVEVLMTPKDESFMEEPPTFEEDDSSFFDLDYPGASSFYNDQEEQERMEVPSFIRSRAQVPPQNKPRPVVTPSPTPAPAVAVTTRQTSIPPKSAPERVVGEEKSFKFEPMPPPERAQGPNTVKLSPERMEFLSAASNGNGAMTRAETLQKQLERVQTEIFALNGNVEFKIESPKQVSIALFGETTAQQSTNKDRLEALGAAGNRMADLILQSRQLSRDLKKQSNRNDHAKAKKIKQQSMAETTVSINTLDTDRSQRDSTNAREDEETRDPLILLDASAYIFRAYYSMPPLHRKDGMPVGAVLGFCNMLNRLVLNKLLEGKTPRILLVMDAKGKTFRHDMYPEYKANRKACPVDLVPQFDLVRAAADAYGILQLEAPTYEADDVIATLAHMAIQDGVNVDIFSSDKDLMQLVTDSGASPSINTVDPMTMKRFEYEHVVEKWGVPPNKLGDVLALAGDASDNIPGVPMIGPKIAASLINEFGGLEALLEKADTIPQKGRRERLMENKDKARLSKDLVRLETSIPIEEITMPAHFDTISEFCMGELEPERLLAFYEEMGFWDLKRRFESRLMKRKEGYIMPISHTSDASPKPERVNNGMSMSKRRDTTIAKPPIASDFEDVPF